MDLIPRRPTSYLQQYGIVCVCGCLFEALVHAITSGCVLWPQVFSPQFSLVGISLHLEERRLYRQQKKRQPYCGPSDLKARLSEGFTKTARASVGSGSYAAA